MQKPRRAVTAGAQPGPSARPRMADIARIAGVTISTVSRALAGSSRTSDEMRERIVQIATAMNYSVNVAAQNLQSGQNNTIAVVVPIERATREPISEPFLLALLGGIGDALSDRGYDMLISRINIDQPERTAQLYDSGRAAGVVMIGQSGFHDQLNRMTARGVPLVVWGTPLPQQQYATVGSDNALGGELVTGHLLDQGARRVAFFGDTALTEGRPRHDGYLKAHVSRGLMLDPALTRPIPLTPDAIQKELADMLANGIRFDAAFAGSDMAAITLISSLLSHGLKVPEDVMVAGYDNIAAAAYTHPPLTTVHQPMTEAGQCLVAAVMRQIEGERAESVMLPTTLVPRTSSARVRPS
ncbi:MAG: substrate-binding domain-containing protein [Pseudomonadota bacterium]